MAVSSERSGRVEAVRQAIAELLAQEFDWTTGHLATLLSGCVFAPSLFTFWLVNGILDFSTALAIGSVGSPGGLVVRLIAYLLLVPVFLLLRAGYYLVHPVHRQTVLNGACPQSEILSLDWFSVGILATGLPLALQELGPWIGMNTVFVLGLFVIPRGLQARRRVVSVKLATIGLGTLLFVYARYGASIPVLPAPATVLGPIATFTLTEATTDRLLAVTNSLATGPLVVAAFAVLMNWVLTRDELQDLPMVRHTLPRYDPPRLVATSAVLGTVFYLAVVAMYTGDVAVLP
ncbi:MAG: hypothetical protein ABEI76_00070 [Halobacteriales archaeon]